MYQDAARLKKGTVNMRSFKFPRIKVGRFDETRSNMLGSNFSKDVLPNLNPPLFHPEFNNGLVGTIHEAYNHHIPLKLKPDDFWISIQMSLCNYIQNNHQKFQNILVHHKVETVGKKTIGTNTPPFDNPEKFIDDIFFQVKVNSKFDVSLLLPNFTTTTRHEVYVSKAVVMGQMKSYFSYFSFGMCGIPEYQILGTQKDWENLIVKVDMLLDVFEDSDLSNWKSYLKFVFEHFVRIDPEDPFWQKPYSYEYGGSGSDYITGWSGVFSPFTLDGRSNLLPFDRNKILKDNSHIFVTAENIIPTLVEIPIETDGKDRTLVVGMFLRSDDNNRVISPYSDYFVV